MAEPRVGLNTNDVVIDDVALERPVFYFAWGLAHRLCNRWQALTALPAAIKRLEHKKRLLTLARIGYEAFPIPAILNAR